MVGDRARREVTQAVTAAAEKAGSLVMAALGLAAAALLLALGVFVFALRTRPRLAA